MSERTRGAVPERTKCKCESCIDARIAEAVAQEREACAKLMEACMDTTPATFLASAIRSRDTPAGGEPVHGGNADNREVSVPGSDPVGVRREGSSSPGEDAKLLASFFDNPRMRREFEIGATPCANPPCGTLSPGWICVAHTSPPSPLAAREREECRTGHPDIPAECSYGYLHVLEPCAFCERDALRAENERLEKRDAALMGVNVGLEAAVTSATASVSRLKADLAMVLKVNTDAIRSMHAAEDESDAAEVEVERLREALLEAAEKAKKSAARRIEQREPETFVDRERS